MSGILSNLSPSWELIFVLSALWMISRAASNWYRLRNIKGLWYAGFSKLWMIYHVAGNTMHQDLVDVCNEYGTIARIGPNDLVTSDPEVVRRMSGVRSTYTRSDFYDGMRLHPDRDNVLTQRNDAKHHALRAKLIVGYSGKENDDLEGTVNRNVMNLVNLIDSRYISEGSTFKPVDFARKSQYFTLDVISDVAFGEAFGDLEADADNYSYIEIMERFLPALMMLTALPWLNYIMQSKLLRKYMPSDKDPSGLGKLLSIAKRVVEKRFQPGGSEKRDMLGSFIRHGLTPEEAEGETAVQIIAGSDSTASAIRATMLHTISNPRALGKLIDEIAQTAPQSPITDAEAKRMPYLQAVIKEVSPLASGLFAKQVLESGDIINGLFILGGTNIGWCAFGIFFNKEIFGEDAACFRPERWLDCSAEKLKERDSTLELIFYHGKWQCLGKSLALMELNKVFVELLRKFDSSIVDPAKPWKSVNKGFMMQSDMWMRVTRRNPQL